MRSLVLISFLVCVSAVKRSRMHMERSGSADLETSASGYIYQSSSGHPSSFVHFSNNPGAVEHVIQPVPVAQYVQQNANPGYYVPHHQPQYIVPIAAPLQQYVAKPEALTIPIALIKDKEADEGYGDEEGGVANYEEGDDDEEEGGLANYEEGDKGDDIQGGGITGAYIGGEKSFKEEGAEEHNSAKHSAHGEKGDKGYKSQHGYKKGEKGDYAKDQNEGFYKEEGGKKAGNHDSGSHYNAHHEKEQASKGEKFGEAKKHKKGQKTTGFHNVYHKDEYKKDHTFYDEADRSGHFNKHGSYASNHGAKDGGYKKGGKSDAGYHDDHYGKKGSHNKGHFVDEEEGFKGQKGQESYHSSEADYANEKGKSGGAKYGYSQAEGGQGKYH